MTTILLYYRVSFQLQLDDFTESLSDPDAITQDGRYDVNETL